MWEQLLFLDEALYLKESTVLCPTLPSVSPTPTLLSLTQFLFLDRKVYKCSDFNFISRLYLKRSLQKNNFYGSASFFQIVNNNKENHDIVFSQEEDTDIILQMFWSLIQNIVLLNSFVFGRAAFAHHCTGPGCYAAQYLFDCYSWVPGETGVKIRP